MQGERLEPLGACDDINVENLDKSECTKCASLEEEKDLLQNSLFALTTHFAQVQFRLRQVVDAPVEEQEELLRLLEDFAFTDTSLSKSSENVEDDLIETVRKRRDQQKELLAKLKMQLKEFRYFDRQVKRTEATRAELLEHLHMKQNLEHKLKTQIHDLERFIEYLKNVSVKKCRCNNTKARNYLVEIIDRSFSFLQLFALFQFSWGSNCFTVRTRINHWGDLRAKLELAIIDLKAMLHAKEDPKIIALTVRKCLATSIRDLMQHGIRANFFQSSSTHSWDIILHYYNFKRGAELNSSTKLTLSRSFNLEIAGVSPHANKKNLFYVIESIVSTHSRYKRSHDSHFKAFVCAALNARSLVNWLNLIFQSGDVIKTFYYPWSYVAATRYQDGLRSLDMLTHYRFDLPVDLDVRKFQIEDDAFV